MSAGSCPRSMNRALGIAGLAGCYAMSISSRAHSAAPIADDSQSSSSSSSSSAEPASGETKPPRMDKDHPLKVGAPYYPIESKRQGAACVSAVINGHLMPATTDGKPVFYWPEMPIVWILGRAAARPSFNVFLVPKIRKDYELQMGPDHYPAQAREMHQEGECTVHGFVKEEGTVGNVSVSKSTGFAALDQACIFAIQQAPFVPAQANGTAIGAFFDIIISWRLPAP